MTGMKPRNIERHIRAKFEDWLATIEDDKVKELVKSGTICMGGAIASLLLGEKPNDYDFYFKDKETCLAVAEYYVSKFGEKHTVKFRGDEHDVNISVRDDGGRIKIVVKSAGVAGEESDESRYSYFESDPDPSNQEEFLDKAFSALEMEEETQKYQAIFLSANAITLSDKVQLIIRFYGRPTEIRDSYDFVHVTSFWRSWSMRVHALILPKDALLALLSRELKVINGGTKYPFAAICRIRKFLDRGFHIAAGDILKLCFAINELDLRDYAVLEDQLTGVDIAYFQELLAYLDTHRNEWDTEDGKLKVPYLLDLIDRLL